MFMSGVVIIHCTWTLIVESIIALLGKILENGGKWRWVPEPKKDTIENYRKYAVQRGSI